MPQAAAGQSALLLTVKLVSLDAEFCRVRSTAAILDEII